MESPAKLVQRIDHVALTVRNPEASAAWYRETLGFVHRFPGMWDGVPIFIELGRTYLALFPVRGENPSATPARSQLAVQHIAFRADGKGFAAYQETLREKNIPFEFQDHDISHSIYFDDPDGHQLEVTTYDVS